MLHPRARVMDVWIYLACTWPAARIGLAACYRARSSPAAGARRSGAAVQRTAACAMPAHLSAPLLAAHDAAHGSATPSAEPDARSEASLERTLTLWDGMSVTVGLIIGARRRGGDGHARVRCGQGTWRRRCVVRHARRGRSRGARARARRERRLHVAGGGAARGRGRLGWPGLLAGRRWPCCRLGAVLRRAERRAAHLGARPAWRSSCVAARCGAGRPFTPPVAPAPVLVFAGKSFPPPLFFFFRRSPGGA